MGLNNAELGEEGIMDLRACYNTARLRGESARFSDQVFQLESFEICMHLYCSKCFVLT
jgi:hypothetical protein